MSRSRVAPAKPFQEPQEIPLSRIQFVQRARPTGEEIPASEVRPRVAVRELALGLALAEAVSWVSTITK